MDEGGDNSTSNDNLKVPYKFTRKDSFDHKVETMNLVKKTEPLYDRECYRSISFMTDISLEEQHINFGAVLSEYRIARGIKQDDMAELLNTNRQTYGRYERGETVITLPLIIMFCEIMKINPVELMVHSCPQLFGNTHQEALKNASLFIKIMTMDDTTKELISRLSSN